MSTDKVALVTGSASGIGAACAAAFSRSGWSVAGLDLVESVCDVSLLVDVAEPGAVARALGRIEETLGPVEALVSAAGHYEMTPFGDLSEDAWSAMLRVHLGGLLNTARGVVPSMLARGGGNIVAVASELAIAGGNGDAHYAAAKGAVIGLVRSLAVELAPRNIRVNAVAPGPTDTALLTPESPWRAPEYLATLPVPRLATPEEIAETVCFIVERATFLVGEVLSPNSGAVI